MYRIRLGCAAYARMNIAADQARRMMYILLHFTTSDIRIAGDSGSYVFFFSNARYRSEKILDCPEYGAGRWGHHIQKTPECFRES